MDLEARIQTLGRELAARVDALTPSVIQPYAWEFRILDWCMQDPCLKTQILRFVDVLPTLTTPRQVVRHLQTYFPHPAHRLPLALRVGLAASRPSLLTAQAVSAATHAAVTRIARLFLAGRTLSDAQPALTQLTQHGMTVTLDPVGEQVTSDAEAEQYLHRMVGLLEAMPPPAHLSIKLSSLDPQFDPIAPERCAAVVTRRLGQILQAAEQLRGTITVDAEMFSTRDLTLQIVQALRDQAAPASARPVRHPAARGAMSNGARLGVVVQAYLRDAEDCLERLLDWASRRRAPFAIRLVKGAYWDTEVILARQRGWPIPVFTQKGQTDAAFERLTARLLAAHEVVRPEIATHNLRSLAHAIAVAESLGLTANDWECQLLYGMGDAIKQALVERGLAVRVYTPVGDLLQGMAYLVRRLLENTANDSFLRQSMTHERPLEELLAPPDVPKGSDPIRGQTPSEFQNEPETDFRDPQARTQMAEAIRAVRTQGSQRYPLFIGRSRITTDLWMTSRNPSHPEEVVGSVARAERQHVEMAVKAAAEAFPAWSQQPPAHRAELLRRVAEAMRRRRMELAAWEVVEVGKPWREADADVAEAIDYLEYYSRELLRWAEPVPLVTPPGERNLYRYRPLGPGAVIAPWNFPLAIPVGMTAAAIAAGNTVILKPAEQSSCIAAHWVALALEHGLPPGVLVFLPGLGEEVGERLVDHPQLRFIAFTGSKAVGLAIAERAARVPAGQPWVKRVIAEMGGKNAIVVEADADLDEAVRGVALSAFSYSGQKCSACSRVIVRQEVYDRFLQRLIEATRSLPIGPAEDPATVVGPLVDEAAKQRVVKMIAQGEREGRLALRVTPPPALGGYFVGPVILTDLPPTARTAQEEIFGPVLALFRVRTFEEAIALANATDYGLTGGLYCRNPELIQRAQEEWLVGNLYINRKITGALVGRQPFGGIKLSGIGSKAGGPDYLKQFGWPQSVAENTLRHGVPADAMRGVSS